MIALAPLTALTEVEAVVDDLGLAFPTLSDRDLAKVYDQWNANAPEGDMPHQYDCQIYSGKADWYCDCAEWGIEPGEPIVWVKVRGGYAFIG